MSDYARKIRDFICAQKRAVPREPAVLRSRLLEQDAGALRAARELAELVSDLPEDRDAKGQKPRALLVGGFVRDAILGLHPKDADLEVYGVPAASLQAALEQHFPGRVELVGKAYGVIKVAFEADIDIDIAIPRPPFGVNRALHHSGDPSIPPEQGGRLRDFTMNNVAADPHTLEVFDWWGGIDDLNSNILRATYPEFFVTDPLCVWRAVQFSARRQLIAEPKTMLMMQHMVREGTVDEIEPYQRRLQLHKLFFKSNIPSIGFELLRESGLLERYLPELSQSSEKANNWDRTLRLTDIVSDVVQRVPYEPDEHEIANAFGFALCTGIFAAGGSEDELIEKVHSVAQGLGFSPQFGAAIVTCALQLKQILKFERPPAQQKPQAIRAVGRVPGGLSFRPRETGPAERALEITKNSFPASWKTLHICAAAAEFLESGERRQADAFLKAAQSLGDNELQRETLLTKEDLTRKLRIPRGPHIGLIIGEIEKRRFELVTKSRALHYVKQHLMPE